MLGVFGQSVGALMQGLHFTGSRFMEGSRALFIPVILGTARTGRMSLHAARLVTQELGKCAGVETDFIDIGILHTCRPDRPLKTRLAD